MSSHNICETGNVYGKLTVLEKWQHRGVGRKYWQCICECGTIKFVSQSHLRNGAVVSCGCHKATLLVKWSTTHGMTHSPELRAWENMNSRCRKPSANNFHNYGGRGITVCERWRVFENFLEDVGKRPSPLHSLDRIRNSEGYHPGNVRWATKKQQLRNTRRNVWLGACGVTMIQEDWARTLGVCGGTIRYWLRKFPSLTFDEILMIA
jgi:hypothetical protein